MESFLSVLDSDLTQRYVVLITAVIVFMLTSVFNHWKDRNEFVKQSDTFLSISHSLRKVSDPKFGKLAEGKHVLLKDRQFNHIMNHAKKNPDFKVRFIIIENIGDKLIFDIVIKLRVLYGGVHSRSVYYIKKNMEHKEKFYIPVGNKKYPVKLKTKYMKIKYKTSSGSKYMLIRCSFGKKISNVDLKFKKVLGIFWVIKDISIMRNKYNGRYQNI